MKKIKNKVSFQPDILMGVGFYEVTDSNGDIIGQIRKVKNHKWVSISLPVNTRNEAFHQLLRQKKKK